MESNVKKADRFLVEAFQTNASYSFSDPQIMILHSRLVRDFAFQIAKGIDCDSELLEIMALWHDIGKTYNAKPDVLRKKHNELGYEVTRNILFEIKISKNRKQNLIQFLKARSHSIESTIVKDADILAFFADLHLQKALKTWADANNIENELQRKADKFYDLQLPESKRLAEKLYQKMKSRWGLK
ncbi:MAG: HD domain-containing protein [bacterium]|nr:HD domain-containing protein [bacterium]